MKKVECVFPTHHLQQLHDVLVYDAWQSASVLNVYDGNAADFKELGQSQAFPTKCRFELLVDDNDIEELTQTFQGLTSAEETIEFLVTDVDSSRVIVPMPTIDRNDTRSV
ncbi:hypothetical protein [Thalassoroseus pseudoceratinae]|uniref:hypothetical protein n=1 Tax=Thalassoroseus pseudoceratinae TaxID=2713176 RepID=UPI001422421E|nr:hypothetical protein [Thalassoroseus pseudoceratinae]